MKLARKVALVTGSASGIGRAIALEMAKEGASIAIADLNLDGAGKVAEEVKALGRESLAVRVDVSKSADVNDMVKTVLERFGRVDILVNNAGGSARQRATLFHKSTEEVWDYVLGINLKGVLNCSRAVINHMIERKKGVILNTASVAGMVGSVGRADYSAAKGGIIAFTKSLAKEVAEYGVRVAAVSPGVIETPMFNSIPRAHLQELLKNVAPVGRHGKPEDIAHMMTFLASDDAAFITGHNFVVDGGVILKVAV
ncbi:MAG: glucose 1-dehydrogenase [Chloroflexi bacterium]|nr:glucose 1-dehydrogenase [Chloroflexota bacterium]